MSSVIGHRTTFSPLHDMTKKSINQKIGSPDVIGHRSSDNLFPTHLHSQELHKREREKG
jgi:hypothetical protein